ncbi:hypothetical protein C2E23DRAFT_53660 [Lenzites betulinus]|nr:hypothetical protein C2E23DRAFT_53660 [Lenzites betulinus]
MYCIVRLKLERAFSRPRDGPVVALIKPSSSPRHSSQKLSLVMHDPARTESDYSSIPAGLVRVADLACARLHSIRTVLAPARTPGACLNLPNGRALNSSGNKGPPRSPYSPVSAVSLQPESAPESHHKSLSQSVATAVESRATVRGAALYSSLVVVLRVRTRPEA